MIQQTSLMAYREILDELGERQILIYKGFKNIGQATNLEISNHLGIPINQVTPRTNELVKIGILKEVGKRKCNISGRNAIIWGIK